MGGKTWSRDEELYFWRTIVPMSPKAAVPFPARQPVDWEQCACNMQRHFGKAARRKYTKLMLFEHYFQNITTGHESPRAADLVAEHRRHLEAHGKNKGGVVSTSRKPRARRAAKNSHRSGGPSSSVSNAGIQKARNNEAVGVDSGSISLMAPEVHAPPAQMPGVVHYYHHGYYHPGAASFPPVIWSKANDSGYVSAPSSLGGSPATPPTAVPSSEGTDATADADGRAVYGPDLWHHQP